VSIELLENFPAMTSSPSHTDKSVLLPTSTSCLRMTGGPTGSSSSSEMRTVV
jgi:hypothetical protein